MKSCGEERLMLVREPELPDAGFWRVVWRSVQFVPSKAHFPSVVHSTVYRQQDARIYKGSVRAHSLTGTHLANN